MKTRSRTRIRSAGRVLYWSIVALVVVALFLTSAVIAIRSGLFNFKKGPLTSDELKAFWGFVGSGVTAAVTLVALHIASSQNRRSEARLNLDTAVKGIGLTQTFFGEYGTNAVVAGSLATLAYLQHPVIAMRMLAAAWNNGAVDAASAVWLINEVLENGTPASQVEAARLFNLHAAELCSKTPGKYYIPSILEQTWPRSLPHEARVALIFGLVKLLITEGKPWWIEGHLWECPIFRQIIKTDRHDPNRKFAYEVLVILLPEDPNLDWDRGFLLGKEFISYDQVRRTRDSFNSQIKGYKDPETLELLKKLKRWMENPTSEASSAAKSGQESVVLASFDSYRHAEHMLASLGREFRKKARKGGTTAVVVTGNPDGSLKLTESRVLTASDFAATLIRISLSWMVGFMGLFSTLKGAKSQAHAAHVREGHVGSDEHQAHKILAEAGPHAAIALVRCKDQQTRQMVAAAAADSARGSWDGPLTEFLAALDPGSDHDWVRAAVGEPSSTNR